MEFNLTREWLEKKLTEEATCDITGQPFVYDEQYSDWGPSLDRVDNNIGYTIGNVQVVCWKYNNMKGAYTDEDILFIADCLRRKHEASL